MTAFHRLRACIHKVEAAVWYKQDMYKTRGEIGAVYTAHLIIINDFDLKKL